MSQLSDRSIRRMMHEGHISIEPRPHDRQMQSCSVDLLLGKVTKRDGINTEPGERYLLRANEFALACTYESVMIPPNVVARVEGKSGVGREALMVECAGLVDPGFHGQITLELKNLDPEEPFVLIPETAICQISFTWLDFPAQRPYGSPGLGSHYQGQTGPTKPRR